MHADIDTLKKEILEKLRADGVQPTPADAGEANRLSAEAMIADARGELAASVSTELRLSDHSS